MHPGAVLQSIYCTKGIPDRRSLLGWEEPSVSPTAALKYCMKSPQANLNIHIIRDSPSPKIVPAGDVLWLLCKSHGGTEGLAGARSCSSPFQFPGLIPISCARKRSGEEAQFPSCVSSPCKQGWKHTFRWEKPFCNPLCLPKQRDRVFSLGRQIPGCPRSCLQRSSARGIAENQWAASPHRRDVQRTASDRYGSPFLHLTHHLAVACR